MDESFSEHISVYSNGTKYALVSNSKIYAPEDSTRLFENFTSLESFNFKNFYTDKATNLSRLFQHCDNLTSVDVSKFNVSNVTMMQGVFNYCGKLTSLDLNNWDMSSVTDMTAMFQHCESLTTLDVSTWNTSNVTNMSGVFNYCTSLINLDLSNWNTSKVKNFAGMFQHCDVLTNLDVSNFDISSATTINHMFNYCCCLTNIDTASWDTSNVTNMRALFQYCKSITSVDLINLILNSSVDIAYLCNGCESLNSVILPNNISKFSQMMFAQCPLITSIDLDENNNITFETSVFYKSGLTGEFHISKNWTLEGVSNGAFHGTDITKFILDEDDTRYMSYNNDGCVYRRKSSDPTSEDYNIPSYLELYPSGSLNTTYTIPSTMTGMRSYELDAAKYLEMYYVEEGNTTYKAIDGILYRTWGQYLCAIGLPNNYESTDVVIGSDGNELINIGGLGSYDDQGFGFAGDYSKIESLTVLNPETVTMIAGCAMETSENLKRINSDIDGVFDFTAFTNMGRLGYKSIMECHQLTTLKLPTSLTLIGSGAFMHAENLTDIYLYNDTTVVTIEHLGTYTSTYAENFANENFVVHVPASMLESYLANANWATIASHIVGDL